MITWPRTTGERTVTGWLFDLYPVTDGIAVWLIGRDGTRHRCTVPFVPFFYMRVNDRDVDRVKRIVHGFPFPVTLGRERQREIYADEECNVLRVNVHSTLHLKSAVRRLERHFPHYVFFNSDIPPAQLYLYTTGLFPLARGEFNIDEGERLRDWRLEDRRDDIEYALPELVRMTIRHQPDFVSPKYRKSVQLEIGYDGATYGIEHADPADVLQSVNSHLRRCDPDILLTEYGDAVLLPMLAGAAEREGIPLLLNRDASTGYFTSASSSYFAYGKIVHKDGAFELAGRWHLDTANSFMMGESSLDGVVEIARLTQLPVQHQSRATIGSALSSMQLSWAYSHGYLIPAKKREPEEFKSAATLLLADRGGLIFQPVPGFHEQVAELDFVSMYPTIMVEHNISPETVNCRCCHNAAVPELEYTICERREGIVPSTLRTVVRKRALYKRRKKELKAQGDPVWMMYDRRQNALKWMLVTCFGYLGYKNARFGRIEAHESVNAFSRDAILRAKEIAEENGFQFLHAIVDCMWVKKTGAGEQDYEQLAEEVRRNVDIDISLEGIYSWILFPASKMDPRMPTASRYVGWYTNDEIKIRGVEIRRRDTPVFIKRLQGEILRLFGRGRTVAEVELLVPVALNLTREQMRILRSGAADPHELVIRRHVSREADEYTNRSQQAEVTRALKETGIRLAPGELIEYVIVDATGKRKPEKARPLALYSLDEGYDIEKYTEMTLKAVETLLLPFGYDVNRLMKDLDIPQPRGRRQAADPPRTMTVSREPMAQFPLFDGIETR
jgi:DNA polymerase-2